jgi:hypothetical protein
MKSNMKKTIILGLTACVSLLVGVSCMPIDNFDAPDCRFTGTVIDATTGQPILASQGQSHIRIWEKSYSLRPDYQDIPLKQDGSFNNNKLFAGTYDVLPEGPWWPCDTVRNVGIGKSKSLDFEVTPYLSLIDFEARLEGTTLYMSCRLDAPRGDDPTMPMIMEARPYISLNQFCGPGANGTMGYYNNTRYVLAIGKTWPNLAKDADGKSVRQELPPIDLKAGYTYFVRMGAKVRDARQDFNLTEIVQITVPN